MDCRKLSDIIQYSLTFPEPYIEPKNNSSDLNADNAELVFQARDSTYSLVQNKHTPTNKHTLLQFLKKNINF